MEKRRGGSRPRELFREIPLWKPIYIVVNDSFSAKSWKKKNKRKGRCNIPKRSRYILFFFEKKSFLFRPFANNQILPIVPAIVLFPVRNEMSLNL